MSETDPTANAAEGQETSTRDGYVKKKRSVESTGLRDAAVELRGRVGDLFATHVESLYRPIVIAASNLSEYSC
jgi:hypothetical protein